MILEVGGSLIKLSPNGLISNSFAFFEWKEKKKLLDDDYGNSLSPVHSSQLPAGCDSRKASLALLSLMLLGLSSLRRT